MDERHSVQKPTVRKHLDELSQKVESQSDESSELIAPAKEALQRSREIMERARQRKTTWK